MAGSHRTKSRRQFSVALVSAATATATALTVGVQPPPDPAKRVRIEGVDLTAAIQLLPTHDKVPDITGGLGTTIYNGGQAISDVVIRAVVNGIKLSALAQAAGVDPKSLITGLLADLPANLLPGILATLSLDIPLLGPVLEQLTGGDLALLTSILDLLQIDEVTGATLTGVLALLGLDLSDPLNLSNLNVPGLNVVTSGPAFAALKMLGIDLGWVPALPNSVAADINGTPYARLGVDGVLDLLLGELKKSPLGGALALIAPLTNLIASLSDQIPDVIDVRVVPTVGMGFGAFAAAMAYEKVLADLSMQPGGLDHVFGADPILGSLTILPLILINNPARPDGGALARFGPLAALFGINTVNPTTHAANNGDDDPLNIPVLGTGVELGHANLLPILIDATYEYQPLSDLASWPNPFTLLNNLAAGLSPTYMLRGLNLDLDGLTDQILEGVGAAVDGIDPADPKSALAINLYLTLHSATLPMLEPLYLTSDVLNIVGLNPLAQIPMRLANALAPALRILTDAGYANTVRNPDGTYERDFSQAGTEVPFLSFPKLNPGLVLSDAFNALVAGFQKELGPNPTAGTPNVLANILKALLKGDLLDGLGVLKAPLATPKTTALSKTAAEDVPSANAQLLSVVPSGGDAPKGAAPEQNSKFGDIQPVSGETTPAAGEKTPAAGEETPGDEGDKETSGAEDDKTPVVGDKTPAAGDKTPDAGDKTPAAGDKTPDAGDKAPAANEDPKPASGPKHAKPEGDSTPSVSVKTGKTNAPKHAKPQKPNAAGVKTGVKAGADKTTSDKTASDKTGADGGSADKAA
ncbi:hypothetical protein ASD37_13680 [Mycobacterium sp. Root135]|uniref:hypothetical protein n=1 Tax=Mycobacterium sp. Root135 TaxID=1736457 RepID=UPI0006F49D0B|nr:hypothetical protein [Mycobacterium sp. Root135]KQY07131.1 hypothetical protein ASD37_13680 [Mycobacterium sp. Root135]